MPLGVKVLTIALLHESVSRLETLYNLGSGRYDTAAHCTMQPYIAHVGEQIDRGLQLVDIPPPQSATLGLYLVSCIFHPAESRRLS